MKFFFAVLIGCMLACSVDTKKLISQRIVSLDAEMGKPWCEFNVFPNPTQTFDARGLPGFGNVISGDNLKALQEALAATDVWHLGRKWQFKAKVTSGYAEPLKFGVPGGDGFFMFDVAASADGQIIDLTETVKCDAEEFAFQYRGLQPAVLSTHSVVFSEICLRQTPCSEFEGCVPSYHYKAKANATGDNFDQCCQALYCKDSAGCVPSTQWEEVADFDKRMGYDVQHCCKPKFCPADVCGVNSTTSVLKSGTGILGSTEEECCTYRYCADFTGCLAEESMTKKPDTEDDGEPRLGSTAPECCHVIPCSEFNCSSGNDLWKTPDEAVATGHTFAECCEPLFCSNFSCNLSKYKDKPNAPVQGDSPERCCEPVYCSSYTCPDTKVLMSNPSQRKGSTDDECCESKLCKDYRCSDLTKYVKKPLVIQTDTGGQISRLGFTDDECCSPLYCKSFACTSSKWQNKGLTDDDTTLGSTFEACCDKIFCENYTCTSDYDGDGNGTQWYKRMDTNAFKWQGSTDEECCHPRYCSQYTTENPTKWKRKSQDSEAVLGSTDRECYDALMCDTFCECPKAKKVLRPDAKSFQGSTVAECCTNSKEH